MNEITTYYGKVPEKNRSDKLGQYFPYIIMLGSIISGIYCMISVSELPSVYSNLWLLPTAHVFIVLIFNVNIFKGDLSLDFPALIIVLVYTVRNTITPAIMCYEKYFYSKMGIAQNSNIANTGIFIFIWETVLAFLAVYYYSRHAVKYLRFKSVRKSNQLFRIILFSGLGLSILLFFVLPEIRTEYYTIFNRDITHIVTEEVTYSGGIKRALSTASNLIIEGVRTALSAYIIFSLRRIGSKNTYYLCFGVVILQFFFMNDSNAYIIMIAISLCVLIMKLYPENRKRTIKYIIMIGIAFSILITINRFLNSSWAQSLSLFLQGYFPGLSNFCSIESILDMHWLLRIRQVIYDLYACIPFRSTLFGYKGGMDNTNTLWVIATGRRNQILPNMALGYFYFGGVLAPVLSLLMIRRAYMFFDKLRHENNPIRYVMYFYMTMYACITPVLYNNMIFIKMFLGRYLFMWLFSVFSNFSFHRIQDKLEYSL